MIDKHALGSVLSVHAQPAAKKNEIRGLQADALKICVTAAPEKGKANKALIELLAKSLKIKKSQIELLTGDTSHQKKFLFTNVAPEELNDKIQPFLN
ncbi:MAG: DUF167 domain-containing protein [Thermoguttaceae bacterium]